MQYKEIKSVSFNCLGFKSSSALIDNLCIEYDICFLREHWLKPLELPFVKSLYKDKNIWSHLKSSVDPESVSSGRPHGGVGFLFKESGDVTYWVLEVSSDRLCAIQVISSHSVILTCIGVYGQFSEMGARKCDT